MIKLFTHNDLDGLGCVLLAQLAYGIDQVEFETCRHEDIDEKVQLYMDEKKYQDYTYCFITDIALHETMAHSINQLFEKPSDYISIIDHHVSTIGLNIHDWCHITVEDANHVKCCGTSLFYQTLLGLDVPFKERLLTPLVKSFVEKVRRYDVWDWQAANDLEAKQLDDLFSILGKDRFMAYWSQRLAEDTNDFYFDETQKLLLELRQNEINQFIESRHEEMMIRQIGDYEVGIVFAGRFQSELGNQLALLHPELDFIAMINVGGGVSCRCVKEDVDLASLAASYGGGGHKKAAGFPISDALRQEVINRVFHVGNGMDAAFPNNPDL